MVLSIEYTTFAPSKVILAMSIEERNEHRKATLAETMLRRESQECHVFLAKVVLNKLNATQEERLKMLFVEAKWIKNDMLNKSNDGENIFDIDYKDLATVRHLDKDGNPLFSKIEHLSSQMRQAVVNSVKQEIISLAKAKEKGLKVGVLKFVSEYKSIDLKQSGITYKIVSRNKVKIQGIKKPIRVRGLDQFLNREGYELANAKLLKKAYDYYIAITVFLPKRPRQAKKACIGVDFGCSKSFTLSDGTSLNYCVEEDKRLKKVQRKLQRCEKGSSNHYKTRIELRHCYNKLNNKKNDATRKVVNTLSPYKVYMQDEQLRSWKVKHGKKVQHGILGRVKTLLMKGPETVVLHRSVPTTKLCTRCGHKNDGMQLWDRTFVCPECGWTEDRDVHAAKNMVWIGQNIIGAERAEYTPADFKVALARHFGRAMQETTESSVQW